MNSQVLFLEKIIATLEDSGIPYMVAGSFGSSFHGEARATNDIDIVIAPSREQLEKFIQTLEKIFYADAASAREAFEKTDMFNVIDVEGGWKADLIIRKNRPFSVTEFERRKKVRIGSLGLCLVTPEDAILSKLEWAAESGSELQYRDALGIMLVNSEALDIPYLRHWAGQLGVADKLEELLAKAR